MQEKINFHGGCNDCTNHISICPNCMYMQSDWYLPDLNPKHIKEKNEQNKLIQKAKSYITNKKHKLLYLVENHANC